MKTQVLLSAILFLLICPKGFSSTKEVANQPDSVYLFSYATTKDHNTRGLHFAWSIDQKYWHSIGPEYGYVKSDFGRWGVQKRMIDPYLMQDSDGLWHCVWSLNENEKAFAHASSQDLVDWKRQSYPMVEQGNCLRPVLKYNPAQKLFELTYVSSQNKYYCLSTANFKSYTPVKEVPSDSYVNSSKQITLAEGICTGQVHRVAWTVVDKLIGAYERKQYNEALGQERTEQDADRFADLKPVEVTVTVEKEKAKPISDKLIGIFFEDINYAADGGLYAELIQNRDFEYALSDKEGNDPDWNSTHSWRVKGESTLFSIATENPLHPNNPHYALLEVKSPGASLVNSGFDGIVVKKGEKYDLSVFTKQIAGKGGKVLARIVDKNNQVVAQATLNVSTAGWKKQQSVLTATADAANASLELQPLTPGSIGLDMISLFPQKTFKGRKNGLRADLAQLLADLHPRFVRFPGGCVAHGDGIHNIYRWVNTVGPLEARKPQRNLWGYHQTAGLGYFEYFQFCEDIGAEPLPVLAAGVPCQNSAVGGGGQQGGIPLCEMDNYVKEILDLVEYANGDAKKTKWGKVRAEAGHPLPFNLKYIGIGNEDLITDLFEERFTLIYNAMKEKHPEITVIGTVGPSFEGTDYKEGWDLATKLNVPMVDEHYYQSPGWFINNQKYYDSYDRAKSKVYLGEYAAHLPGRPNNLETALAEALYLTAIERNGDVVSMTSYAPLLAKENHTQWNPNLIYFNNEEVKPTVDYFVQQLYGRNSGDEYLPVRLAVSNQRNEVKSRIAVSVVRDSKTNDVIVKLVNMLPVSVRTEVNLNGLEAGRLNGTKTILTGSPADKQVRPKTESIQATSSLPCNLPAYSFTVIRLTHSAK